MIIPDAIARQRHFDRAGYLLSIRSRHPMSTTWPASHHQQLLLPDDGASLPLRYRACSTIPGSNSLIQYGFGGNFVRGEFPADGLSRLRPAKGCPGSANRLSPHSRSAFRNKYRGSADSVFLLRLPPQGRSHLSPVSLCLALDADRRRKESGRDRCRIRAKVHRRSAKRYRQFVLDPLLAECESAIHPRHRSPRNNHAQDKIASYDVRDASLCLSKDALP